MIFTSQVRFSEKKSRQPKCVKPKMKEHKLKSGANWQAVFEQKAVKQRAE